MSISRHLPPLTTDSDIAQATVITLKQIYSYVL